MSSAERLEPDRVTVRPLGSWADFDACVELQKLTWGPQFTECVPASILMISLKVGGVGAGAFDLAGAMLGFVWGLTGLRHGQLAHWSHMLAVREEAQNLGLGQRLKALQRTLLLELGVERMYWTYDPLVAKNAHLNLNRLGVEVEEYVPDLYRSDTASDLHSGLGTDRFIVRWDLRRTPAAGAAPIGSEALPVTNPDGNPTDLPDLPAVRVAIPTDIMAVKAASHAVGMAWRRSTRQAFLHYLGRGYRVEAFHRDPTANRCYYVVRRASEERPAA